MARRGQRLPFTTAAMLHVLRDYRDVDFNSDKPEDRKRQDAFLREWAQMHTDADLPVPGFLKALLKGADKRRARGYEPSAGGAE